MSKRKPLPKTIQQASVMDELITGSDPPTLPEQEKSKKDKEAARRRQRAKNQVRYDLPPGMKDKLTAIANELSVPPSHVAAFLLADAFKRLDSGDIDPTPHLEPTKSLKHNYRINAKDWHS